MIRWIENEGCTFASAYELKPGRLWLCPVLLARKGTVDHRPTVVSLMLIWGWDEQNPFCWLPRSDLNRRMTGLRGDMLDVSLTLSWLGFNVVMHGCTEIEVNTAKEAST